MDRLPEILRAFFLCAALLGTSPSRASDADRVTTMQVELSAAWYENVDVDVLAQVARLEAQIGRKFTPQEIAVEVEKLTGQMLKRNCFTCRMRVLTPIGYVPLSELKIGDVVLSWDEAAQVVVPNQIVGIYRLGRRPFGKLTNTPTSTPLEVSGGHPFLLPKSGEYVELEQIKNSDFLRGVQFDERKKQCEANLVARGEFVTVGEDELTTLSVMKHPYNFIVEGLVVHNKPRRLL